MASESKLSTGRAVVQQFAGNGLRTGRRRNPLPDQRLVDVGAIEQERRQLKCREQTATTHDDDAPDANPARHVGIRYHRQQANRKRAHISVDQMGQVSPSNAP